jgi:tetratricopeptide (TPR) repeat protein
MIEHDAYRASLLRQRAMNLLSSSGESAALAAAVEAIEYPALSLPSDPLADTETIDAQAFFDWACALETRGIVYRHMRRFQESLGDLDNAEVALQRILVQYPMAENFSALAMIHHHRGNTRSEIADPLGAGRDFTIAIQLRRKLAEKDPEEADLLAGSLKARAPMFLLIGKREFAMKDATEAVSLRREALPLSPDWGQRHVFAMTLYTMAHVAHACGEKETAAEALVEALKILKELDGPTAPAVLRKDREMCEALGKLIGV